MAFDTVIDKAQLEGAITASADAIRKKTGGTGLIEWLSDKGFAEAIAAISTGGGPGVEMPEGYAMEMGIYNPEEHVYTTPVTIPLKNTYIWNQSNRTTNTYLFLCGLNYPTGSQGVLGAICARMNTVSARRSDIVSSGSSTTTTSTHVIDLADGATSNTLELRGTGSYPMRKGVDYLWVVIGATV